MPISLLGFTSCAKQEEVLLRVFRGEKRTPDENTYLGELSLPISPPQNDQVPVGAVFDLDPNGIIHFTAVQFPMDISAIVEYATEHDGSLDLIATDNLTVRGEAKIRSTEIKSGATK